ncbi:MAG: hypothetical protein RLY11_1389 [Bacteroidota bacterium]|jgi:hypothetical protein
MNELMANEVLMYLYNEVPEEECDDFKISMENNPILMKLYNQFKETADQINSAVFQPSPSSIQTIMDYAQQSH